MAIRRRNDRASESIALIARLRHSAAWCRYSFVDIAGKRPHPPEPATQRLKNPCSKKESRPVRGGARPAGAAKRGSRTGSPSCYTTAVITAGHAKPGMQRRKLPIPAGVRIPSPAYFSWQAHGQQRQCMIVTANTTMMAALSEHMTARGTISLRCSIATPRFECPVEDVRPRFGSTVRGKNRAAVSGEVLAGTPVPMRRDRGPCGPLGMGRGGRPALED